jgi:hypothetical protein
MPAPVDLQHDQLPDVISERLDVVLARLERVEGALREQESREAAMDFVI